MVVWAFMMKVTQSSWYFHSWEQDLQAWTSSCVELFFGGGCCRIAWRTSRKETKTGRRWICSNTWKPLATDILGWASSKWSEWWPEQTGSFVTSWCTVSTTGRVSWNRRSTKHSMYTWWCEPLSWSMERSQSYLLRQTWLQSNRTEAYMSDEEREGKWLGCPFFSRRRK